MGQQVTGQRGWPTDNGWQRDRGEAGIEGHERQEDAEQLAALRRLRATFGHVEVVEVVADTRGARMDPRRMTPEELAAAEALLRRAVMTPAPTKASYALGAC
jgi:hypothetical protein